MRTARNALIAAASVGALMVVLGTSPVEAGAISFQWDPSTFVGVAPSTLTFTSNDLTIADYAVINATAAPDVNNNVAVTENAALLITNANPINPSALDGNGQSGTGTYQLYLQVHTTSTLNLNTFTGQFTSIAYTLFGVQNGGCSFAATTTSQTTFDTGCGTKFALATGQLAAGGNSVGINSDNEPTASANVTIVPDATNGAAFFVNPAATSLSLLDLQTIFTNTTLASFFCSAGGIVMPPPLGLNPPTNTSTNNTGCIDAGDGGSFGNLGDYIIINGGGGDIQEFVVPVPEPVTMSLFGAGLIGAAALRRRKAKKA